MFVIDIKYIELSKLTKQIVNQNILFINVLSEGDNYKNI